MPIELRWKIHCRDAKKERCEHRPLYSAIGKYGSEMFTVECIDFSNDPKELEEKEIFWIREYGSYSNGYNATLGGSGKAWLDYDKIIDALKNNPNAAQVARELHCSKDSVRRIAHQNGVYLPGDAGHENVNKPRPVERWTCDGSTFCQAYDSYSDAVKWCVENGFAAKADSGQRSIIGQCVKGKRSSAFGWIWKAPEAN